MICDIHIRITDKNFPDLEIVITREGKSPVTHSGPYDTFATKVEPAISNVVKQEIDRIVDRRTKPWR